MATTRRTDLMDLTDLLALEESRARKCADYRRHTGMRGAAFSRGMAAGFRRAGELASNPLQRYEAARWKPLDDEPANHHSKATHDRAAGPTRVDDHAALDGDAGEVTGPGTGIWVLRRTGADQRERWDALIEVMVLADGERAARLEAAGHAGDESHELWLDDTLTTATRIGTTEKALPAELAITDVNNS